jgi:hypothetical protein
VERVLRALRGDSRAAELSKQLAQVEAPASSTQKLKAFNQKAVDWCGVQSQLPLGADREIATGFGGV